MEFVLKRKDYKTIRMVSTQIQKKMDWLAGVEDSFEEDQESWCFLGKGLNLFQKNTHSRKQVKSFSSEVERFLVVVL